MTNQRKLATCPTCKHGGEFELLGEQHWPPEVARKFELPTLVVMWSCPHCQTTISEPDLLPYQTEKSEPSLPPGTQKLSKTKPLNPAVLNRPETRIMSGR